MQNIITHTSYRPSLSNSFEPASDIIAGLNNGTFIAVNDSDPVILLKKCEGFYKIYYFMEKPEPDNADWSSIAENILQTAQNVPVYAETTLRGDFDFTGSVFHKLKLQPFRVYLRKSMKKPAEKFEEYILTEYAAPEDAKHIHDLMMTTSNFDVMADHLPTRTELEALIASRRVLKAEWDNNELAGILIFEDTGIKSYLAVLCVASNFRHKKVGYSLCANYLNTHIDSTYFYLWIDEHNKSAAAFYDYFGYRDDGLKNFIFRM